MAVSCNQSVMCTPQYPQSFPIVETFRYPSCSGKGTQALYAGSVWPLQKATPPTSHRGSLNCRVLSRKTWQTMRTCGRKRSIPPTRLWANHNRSRTKYIYTLSNPDTARLQRLPCPTIHPRTAGENHPPSLVRWNRETKPEPECTLPQTDGRGI